MLPVHSFLGQQNLVLPFEFTQILHTHTPDVADVPPDAFSKLVGLGVAEIFLILPVSESWSIINHCL